MGLAVSLALSFVYFVTIPWHPFPGSWLIKAASIAIFSVMAMRKRSFSLALGLAFCALGDALLELSPQLFVAGLVAFLIGHVIYTVTFVRSWRGIHVGTPAIAVTVYSAALTAWLLPATGALRIPVAIYVVAITLMVISALTAEFSSEWVAIGAILFLISDSVLAVNKFRTPVVASGWIVWSTYYAAQVMIAQGYFASARYTAPLRGARSAVRIPSAM